MGDHLREHIPQLAGERVPLIAQAEFESSGRWIQAGEVVEMVRINTVKRHPWEVSGWRLGCGFNVIIGNRCLMCSGLDILGELDQCFGEVRACVRITLCRIRGSHLNPVLQHLRPLLSGDLIGYLGRAV